MTRINKSFTRLLQRLQRRWRAARPGSVLILVIALLVLMALMGTAYISTTRIDRSSMSGSVVASGPWRIINVTPDCCGVHARSSPGSGEKRQSPGTSILLAERRRSEPETAIRFAGRQSHAQAPGQSRPITALARLLAAVPRSTRAAARTLQRSACRRTDRRAEAVGNVRRRGRPGHIGAGWLAPWLRRNPNQ